MARIFEGQDDKDCDYKPSQLAFICAFDTDMSMQQETQSAQILSLYRQLKLQEKLKKCDDLDKNFKKSQLYTNKRLISEISQTIVSNGVNYPKTFQSLTNDINTNIILQNIQLRKQHMLTDPLSGYAPSITYAQGFEQ